MKQYDPSLQILRKVKKEHGFLKIIVREAERHAVHGLFYSALSYLHNDLHANNTSNSEKDKIQGSLFCYSLSLHLFKVLETFYCNKRSLFLNPMRALLQTSDATLTGLLVFQKL